MSVKNDGMMKQSVHEESCLKGLDVAWTWLGKGGGYGLERSAIGCSEDQIGCVSEADTTQPT